MPQKSTGQNLRGLQFPTAYGATWKLMRASSCVTQKQIATSGAGRGPGPTRCAGFSPIEHRKSEWRVPCQGSAHFQVDAFDLKLIPNSAFHLRGNCWATFIQLTYCSISSRPQCWQVPASSIRPATCSEVHAHR